MGFPDHEEGAVSIGVWRRSEARHGQESGHSKRANKETYLQIPPLFSIPSIPSILSKQPPGLSSLCGFRAFAPPAFNLFPGFSGFHTPHFS